VAFGPLATPAPSASTSQCDMLLFTRSLTRMRKWQGIRGKFKRFV
jgi:hypothetical protein